MSSTMARYQYVPLDLSTNQIRLLRLRKGWLSDKIECEVFETDLEPDGVPYEALSYAGADAAEQANISVNDQVAAIPWNLNIALNCLRLGDTDRILWVDFLCIDASNKKEKGHQLTLMGRIFQYAEQVLFWAGPGTDNTDLVMESINKVDTYAKSQGNSHVRNLDERKRLVWPEIVDELGGARTRPYQKRLVGIKDILARPWLRRIWALLEAASAKRASIVCGWRSVSSRTFIIVQSLMDAMPPGHVEHVLEAMPGGGRGQSWLAEKKDLKTLLEKFHSYQARSDEDRIYALLAISSDACDSRILPVDYEIDKPELSLRLRAFLAFGEDVTNDIVKLLGPWSLNHVLYTARQPGSMASRLLNAAVRRAEEPLVQTILNWKGFDINQGSEVGMVPLLLLASARGCTESLRMLLLRDDLDINIESLGTTALETAVNAKVQSVVELLLTRNDIDINGRTSGRLPPLALAVHNGSPRIAELLISRGADVEWKSPHTNKTLLREAVDRSYAAMVRLLISKGAQVEVVERQWGATPLSAASGKGDRSLIPVLIEAGANVEAQHPPFNLTALGAAVENKHWDTAKLLLQFGANPLFLFQDGESISTRSARLKGYDFIEHLLSLGVPLESQDKWGKTPLHMVAKHMDDEGAEFLLGRGARLDIRDSAGKTPLIVASAVGDRGLVSLFLSHGAEIDAQDDDGRTSLMAATSACKLGVVRVLLEKGADTSLRGKNGETALITCGSWIAPGSHEAGPNNEILGLLVKHDADLNAQDNRGRTVLMHLAGMDLLSSVRFLVKMGADKSLKDIHGDTALSLSRKPDVIRFLESN